jgi:endonuclease/exonuclease/phosphatase family metal-dependent hydrolase
MRSTSQQAPGDTVVGRERGRAPSVSWPAVQSVLGWARSGKRLSRVCVAMGLVALGAVAAGLAGPAAADARARFFHFNACGNVCNDGDAEPVAEAIKASILDLRPHAVGLNEMCQTQFRALRRRLRGSAWRMRGRFVVTKRGGSDCRRNRHGKRLYGNAVLTRWRISWKRVRRLPRPDGTEVRKMLCVETRVLRRATRVCSTHISPEGHAKQRAQIRRVARTVTPWVRNGRPVVLMGDFNVEPDSRPLNRIYNPRHPGTSRGVFQEVDEGWFHCRCGEDTQGSRKIDNVFVSGRHFRRLDGNATHSDISDHDPVRGWAARQR